LRNGVPSDKAVDPNQMYLIGFSHVFDNTTLAIAATALFVVVSQLKINVTNAYAGSLAWSNFLFPADTQSSRPCGLGCFQHADCVAVDGVERLSGARAGARAVLKHRDFLDGGCRGRSGNQQAAGVCRQPGLEFKRSNLYDINPVGVGAMGIASLLSIAAFVGLLGARDSTLCLIRCLVLTAFLVSPLIAWVTGGRYYLARPKQIVTINAQKCVICERDYEGEDMAHCPAYQGPICSLMLLA
jgi:hypothetical protein